jgi:TonB-dependent receptor
VVTVTSTRVRGEVEAMNQEKNAQDIVNVIPADVITSLPNANVADAIGRLPSVSLERDEGEGKYIQVRGLESRYTSVTINGVRIPSSESGVRQIKLDAFPSDLLGAIELHKTVSADQEGDGIGGTVNLVTKSAQDVPFYSLGAEGGYNSQAGGRYSGQANGTYARRFGSENELGVVIGGTYDYNGRSINDIEPAPGMVTLPTNQQIPVFTGMDMRDYIYYRRRFGFAGGLDYRLSDSSSIYLKGFFSQFENFGDRWVTSISTGNFLTPTTTDNSGGYSANVQNRRPIEQTYSYVFGGKHDLGSFVWDYNIAFSHAQQHRDNQLEGKFDGPSAAFNVYGGDGYHPQFYPQGGVNYLDPTQYTLSKWEITNENTGTRSTTFATNFVIPYDGGEIKTGIKYRDEDKSNYYNDQTLKYKGDTPYTMAGNLASFTDPHYYQGIYQMGPMPSLWAINNFYQNNTGLFSDNPSDDHQSNDPNNWDAKEKVSAIYIKNTSNLKSSKLEFGVRVEHTNTSFVANQVNVDGSGNWVSTQPLTESKNYTNVLPSISWRYEIDKDTLLRAVFGMAVARPDYSLMVPSLTLNESPANSISAGNPDLKPTKASNFDVLFEHFLNPVGLLSAGIFYKDLTDPIYPASNSTVVGGIYDGFTESKPINGPKANLYGAEVAWKQHLNFLPGFWSGLGTDINFTWTHSEATFDPSTGRSGTAALQRTAPEEANFGLTYDWKGLSMRLGATYNSDMIFAYNYQDGAAGGLSGPNGDTYLYPHTQVDAQASYTFLGSLKVTVSALNITNAVFGFYNGSPQWNIQREFYNRTFTLGLHYTW